MSESAPLVEISWITGEVPWPTIEYRFLWLDWKRARIESDHITMEGDGESLLGYLPMLRSIRHNRVTIANDRPTAPLWRRILSCVGFP